jgi:hypothetical protein
MHGTVEKKLSGEEPGVFWYRLLVDHSEQYPDFCLKRRGYSGGAAFARKYGELYTVRVLAI